jgi:hypothetical protein
MQGKLQSIEATLMDILGALPPTADTNDSIQILHNLPVSFAPSPSGQSLDFLSSVQDKQTPSDSLEQAVDISLPLSSAHGPKGQSLDSPSSVQGKETPPDSPEEDVDTSLPLSSVHGPKGYSQDSPFSVQSKQTLSDSPEEAADIMITTLDEQVKADNIRVLFSALPEVLQCLIDAATVAECLLKDCGVHIIIAILLVAAILCFILYDLCIYTLQDNIILVQ